jgi:hypothetical protein
MMVALGGGLVHDRLHLVWIKHVAVGFGNNMLVNTNWFGWCCGQAFSMIPLSIEKSDTFFS